MPIQLLPPQLANQIAAGEVVERPASVVKELIENSLDAGASHIDVELEKGGSKLIRIRDNGAGIAESELVMALSRHATSKISSLQDLEQITSLGFRGEALASISAVSRLTLTSKPAAQDAAWLATAEGRDMAVALRPAAHPDGTSIEVLDLFFNTPARRRFLRSDKTEFAHIDELIKRLALSRFDVAWSLVHNGQSIRRLPQADSDNAKLKRLALLCGRHFAENALWIENHYDGISLSGWILPAEACQTTASCQYSYVNGRMMRDKLLNHAIRQAYGERLSTEQQPAFVLYLTIPASEVDVNVHPAKHEVRFHQARLVHDFVVSALSDALQQGASPALAEQKVLAEQKQAASKPSETAVQATAADAYRSQPSSSAYSGASQRPASGHASYRGESGARPAGNQQAAQQAQISYLAANQQAAVAESYPVSVPYLLLNPRFALCQDAQQCVLVDLVKSVAAVWQQQVSSAPLLLPVRLTLAAGELTALTASAERLSALGFDILLKDQTAILRAVPLWLRHTAISQWFSALIPVLSEKAAVPLAEIILAQLLTGDFLQAELLLKTYPQALAKPYRQAMPITFDEQALQLKVDTDAH